VGQFELFVYKLRLDPFDEPGCLSNIGKRDTANQLLFRFFNGAMSRISDFFLLPEFERWLSADRRGKRQIQLRPAFPYYFDPDDKTRDLNRRRQLFR
jgi:hypothetical protein